MVITLEELPFIIKEAKRRRKNLKGKMIPERKHKGEKIGGKYFVFLRHPVTNRIIINPYGIPFEHPSFNSANKEVERLIQSGVAKELGSKFVILMQITGAN